MGCKYGEKVFNALRRQVINKVAIAFFNIFKKYYLAISELRNKHMAKKKSFKKYFELIKWFIGSVVLVILTLIIDKGFRERSAGIQEMQAFDKYVEIILKADNIEERWKLSEFFSTVTPTDRLRDRWIDYKKLIEWDYKNFKELKSKELHLKEKVESGKYPKALNDLIKVRKQLEPYEKKLAEPIYSGKANDLFPKNYTQEPLKNDDKKELSISSKNSENNLKVFKDQIRESSLTDNRYKIDEIFQKANVVNNEVVNQLQAELGDPYQNIQTGVGANYKESTFSNQYGIRSKFDNTKQIWPVFLVKITDDSVIITMSENNESETFKTPINNIDWEKMRLFLRTYFLDRLNQLK